MSDFVDKLKAAYNNMTAPTKLYNRLCRKCKARVFNCIPKDNSDIEGKSEKMKLILDTLCPRCKKIKESMD